MESGLVKKARAFAEEIFNNNVFEQRHFHNFNHTQDVVTAAQEIGEHSDLSDDEMESVLVAAWLHDIGYVNGAQHHEAESESKAKELLKSWGASNKKILEVAEAILATQVPQRPKTLISKVLCDADLYHLSTEKCNDHSQALREEWRLMENKEMSDEEWNRTNLEFLETHSYHTPYGQTILQKGKKKNIKRLRKLVHQDHSDKEYRDLEDQIIKLRSKLDKASLLKPDRGIETMFRTTSTNHVMLSQMVDNKANILITINSIILSIVVSVLIRKLEENSDLIVPTILLIVVCLTTIVFAILATRPTVTSGRFTREDIKNKQTNLLFFGNFHAMNIEDYEWSMKEMMKDADYLYGSMIKDIYYLGKVLGRKYRRIRIAYNIFMFGFVVAVISFIVAFAISANHI
ncbi:MAG: HD domain-containing protein [Cyclobacteriaceae bacterium]|nr:HD domain-containing protein [Cyclobacteriaceae bacterium]